MAHVAKTFCRNCSALCSMEIDVEDGRMVAARPDGSASPYGGYLCPKGISAIEFHQDPDQRLFQSLKRQSNGAFATVEAENALDDIAARLKALIDEYGPGSVAIYHGTGAYRSILGGLLEKAFLSAIGSPNLFSTMTIDQSAKWITTGRMGTMASGKTALEDCDLLVIVGNNPVVSHQAVPFISLNSGAPARALEEAKRRGTKIVVVDPRRTETARYADLVIQPLPGQDAALFAAVAHILLRDGTWDRTFTDRFASQLDELRESVAPFTPEMAAARAGIDAGEIEELARLLGQAKRPSVGSGSGPSFSIHSNLNDHMIEVVGALVNGFRRAGDVVRNPGVLAPRKVYEMAVPPTRSWESGPKLRTADIGKFFGEFATAQLPHEIAEPGDGRIRALINFGGNLAMALGDPEVALPALEKLDLLVSLDARENETTRMSDYVIATTQPLERHDITVAGDALFPSVFVQYTRPVIAPPPGVIEDWEFFWAVAARMGLPLTLKYWTYGLDYDRIPKGMDLPVDSKPDAEQMFRFLCHNSRVPFEEIAAHPEGLAPDLVPETVLPPPDNATARIELCPPDIAADLAALTQPERNSSSFPYRLTSRRLLETLNSAYRSSRLAQRRHPVAFAFMNPADMAREQLEDGDRITLRSKHGRIETEVKTDEHLRAGVVSMTHMKGAMRSADQGPNGATGQLTSLSEDIEPINRMPRFSGIPVSVERA